MILKKIITHFAIQENGNGEFLKKKSLMKLYLKQKIRENIHFDFRKLDPLASIKSLTGAFTPALPLVETWVKSLKLQIDNTVIF